MSESLSTNGKHLQQMVAAAAIAEDMPCENKDTVDPSGTDFSWTRPTLEPSARGETIHNEWVVPSPSLAAPAPLLAPPPSPAWTHPTATVEEEKPERASSKVVLIESFSRPSGLSLKKGASEKPLKVASASVAPSEVELSGHGESSSNWYEVLADALSSSLAKMAKSEENCARCENSSSSSSSSGQQCVEMSARKVAAKDGQSGNSSDSAGVIGGGEERGASLSSSSSRTGDRGVSSSSGGSGRPNVVTATTNTSSSGDDRSSSGRNGSGSGSLGGGDGDREDSSGGAGPAVEEEHDTDVGPFLRHHHRHRRRTGVNRPLHEAEMVGARNDAYGLPAISDDKMRRRPRSVGHTVVAAHLPPPLSGFGSSSACAGQGEEFKTEERTFEISEEKKRSELTSSAVWETLVPREKPSEQMLHRSPFYARKGRLPARLTQHDIAHKKKNVVVCGDSSVQETLHAPAASKPVSRGACKRSVAATTLEANSAKVRRQVSSLSKSTGSMSDSFGSSVDGGNSGGSDGGYAASASSNDNLGNEQSSCSSPSISSSEDGDRNDLERKIMSSTPNFFSSKLPGPHDKIPSKKENEAGSSVSSVSSSELADFSSAVSGIGSVEGSQSSPRSPSYSLSSNSDESSDEMDGFNKCAKVSASVKITAKVRSAQTSDAAKAGVKTSSQQQNKKRPRSHDNDADAENDTKVSKNETSSARRKGTPGAKTLREFVSLATSPAGGGIAGASKVGSVDKTALMDQVAWKNTLAGKIGRATSRTVQGYEEELQKNLRSALNKYAHEDPKYSEESACGEVSTKNSLSKRAWETPASLKPSRARFSQEESVKRLKHPDDAERSIFSLGCDIMAHCLSFLDPPEVHSLLTMPLSREWRFTYTMPQDLWKILCLSKPFMATFENDDGQMDSSDESTCSFPTCNESEVKHLFGRYRLLYTSFIRCMRYLARIKDDAIHGRAPTAIDDGGGSIAQYGFNANASLKKFLANARSIVRKNRRESSRARGSTSSSHETGRSAQSDSRSNLDIGTGTEAYPIGVSDDGSSVESNIQKAQKRRKRKKTKYGHSMLTDRLLGPSSTSGQANKHVELPWSCAIYSIVNWMVAFTDVEGIQIMCLKVLPYLLEDENQRTTAQRAGLTDIVLREMVLFPNSVQLHTVAFHSLVLLARPLGGKEGMLFHSAMVNASGIFNIGSSSGKNGIAVMLDSMRRFASDEVLQAMSCWSLVNIALIPSQKTMLVKLGGISVVANTMMQHPYNAEVQFRALFALINLVIPSEHLSEGTAEAEAVQKQLGEVNNTSEREMLDENMGQIANLVVVAMKNFCSSEAILNRACLVLHNLSLNEEYHTTLLWTPNCYQMLEWCLGNYRQDQVLQQSAGGTLQRLQSTLANDNDLRMRFAASIRLQQQSSLEQARREAILLRDQEQQEEQERMRDSLN